MSFFGSTKFYFEVAKGNVPGHLSKSLTIKSVDITNSGYVDIWGSTANIVYPTAAETWEIVSDNANDNIAGTGAQVVFIAYLDDSFVNQTVVAFMDGTTPVVLNADHFVPDGAFVVSSGSGNSNEGEIIIRPSGGGDTRQVIRAGFSQSNDSQMTAPAGKSIFGVRASAFYPKNEDGRVRLIVTPFGTNTEIVAGDFPIYQNNFELLFNFPVQIPERSRLTFRAISTNAGPITVDMDVEIVIVDN